MNTKLLAGQPLGNFEGIGGLSNFGSTSDTAIEKFVGVLSTIIGVLTIVGAIWFIFQLVLAAISWVSSGSDKQALENSQKKITQSLIGLLIVIFAYALIGLVGYVMGIDIFNLGNLINNLQA